MLSSCTLEPDRPLPFLAFKTKGQLSAPRALCAGECSLIDVIIPGLPDDLYLSSLN